MDGTSKRMRVSEGEGERRRKVAFMIQIMSRMNGNEDTWVAVAFAPFPMNSAAELYEQLATEIGN